MRVDCCDKRCDGLQRRREKNAKGIGERRQVANYSTVT